VTLTGFRVSPRGLADSARQLVDVADRVDAAWQSLRSAAPGRGEMFGADMVSSLIGRSYGIARELAADSYGSAADSLARFGQGLAEMAEAYAKADADSQRVIDDAGAMLE
jgi:PE family